MQSDLDRFWAEALGCAARDLREGMIRLVPSIQRQMQILITPDGGVVIGPTPHLYHGAEATTSQLLDPRFWAACMGVPVTRLTHYGPSDLSYVDARCFTPQEHHDARQLERSDAAEVARFARILQAREPKVFHAWSIGGRVTANERLWGALIDGKIVSMGGIRRVNKQLWEVGLNTLPRHRNAGWGTVVASAATAGGLALAPLVQWSAPIRNEPSLRIARRLGYRPYAHQLWFTLPEGLFGA